VSVQGAVVDSTPEKGGTCPGVEVKVFMLQRLLTGYARGAGYCRCFDGNADTLLSNVDFSRGSD